MKPSVKIIKRKQDEDSLKLKTRRTEESVKISTRDLVRTIKRWIAEFQQRELAQSHSVRSLPATSAAAIKNP